MRPFERLTANYGVPRWREIDPTPLVALGFCAMFGLMFGDLGQGAVLAAAGAWLARRRARDAGLILLQCGIASMVFGLAYGSVFGSEGWLPALWLRPLEDLPRLLRTGAAIGLGTISVSFGLGVLNAALRRDWSEALFGTHGLLAASAYWGAAALALRWLFTGEAGEAVARFWPLLTLPLAILLGARVTSGWRSTGGAGRSLATSILEALVELADVVIRGIANTVSFVRISAFAVSHAGLLFAVFALAEMLPSSPGGSVGRVLVIVLGNAIVIALEGLIVSIQGVRLVYYEFFSRFHEGTGVRYTPLQLCAGGGEESAR
jgi:V/A-type H+-transporting ATPase subunit I